MKKHSKTVKIMLSIAVILTLLLITAVPCFASDEVSRPFQAQIWINGEKKGTVASIEEFNKFIKEHPGKGKMVIKNNGADYWDLDQTPIVIPAGAEYQITFEAPWMGGMDFGKKCLFKIEADNVTLDFYCNHSCDDYFSNEYGGFMYITGNNCTIKNLNLENSSAVYGGAIYTKGENTTIESCTFSNCTAEEYGGAIYAEKDRCKIIGCTFTDCTAKGGWAGAIYLNNGGKNKENLALVDNCKFNNCTSKGGYAEALFIGNDYTHVNTCEFYNMTVTDDICYVGYYANVDVRFDNCNFHNNTPAKGYKNFVDIWGTRYTTVVAGCTSDNPRTDHFYHCIDPNASSSTISQGDIWIIAGVALACAAVIIVLVIRKKRKAK